MTAAELGGRMDAAELLEWIEYDRDQLPDSWYQTALICLTVCRLAGNKSATLDDFLPKRSRPAEAGDLKARLLAFAEAHNRKLAAAGPRFR